MTTLTGQKVSIELMGLDDLWYYGRGLPGLAGLSGYQRLENG